CFAATEAARLRGYTAATFSFNVPGGRCETCTGQGFEKVEMQFLSDVYVPCAECGGARFGPEVLEARSHGRNIREVLDLTVAQAVEVFADVPDIARRLRPLVDVGLDYLRLGQPLSTLSGGEAQRVKLAAHLGREGKAHTLFIFDEPTTGLHLADIERLLGCFARLVERGHSLIVIEHNLEVVKCADWVIDLGPEGGDAGGRLVAAGPPEAIAGTPGSHTGRYLAEVLGDGRGARAAFATEVHDAPAAGGGNGCIRIVGAREHNLKAVSLELPRDRLIVITGPSGAGKSSLAFAAPRTHAQRPAGATAGPGAPAGRVRRRAPHAAGGRRARPAGLSQGSPHRGTQAPAQGSAHRRPAAGARPGAAARPLSRARHRPRGGHAGGGRGGVRGVGRPGAPPGRRCLG